MLVIIIVIVVMMVLMLVIMIMVMVMMLVLTLLLFMAGHGKSLCLKIVKTFDNVFNLLSRKLIPGSGNDVSLGIHLFDRVSDC